MRGWLGVVSLEHAKRGIFQGFTQVCHGKKTPLQRMSKGDYFVIYSPKFEMKGTEPYQNFTGIGEVLSDKPYQVEQFPGFLPYRVDIRYLEGQPAPIRPLIEHLRFITDKVRWGYRFRLGHFEIPLEDMALIASHMAVPLEQLADPIRAVMPDRVLSI